MYTRKAAVGKIRALLGDPEGDWVTDSYVNPLLDMAYGTVLLNIKNASAKNLAAVIPIPGVGAGTTSLYPYQNATGQPGDNPNVNPISPVLKGLVDVLEVWVKPAGQPPQYFVQIHEVDSLPHVNPAQMGQWSLRTMKYCWMGNQLQLTPTSEALDFEIHGRFNPQPLVDDGDLLMGHEDIWIPVCFKTAAICGVERTNPGVLEGYQQQGAASEDNVIAELIRNGQASPARFSKMCRGSSTSRWYLG